MKLLLLPFLTTLLTPNAFPLVVGGQNVGIEIKADGLIVSGTYDVKTPQGLYNPSVDSHIEVGDLIYEVERQRIHDVSEFGNIFRSVLGTKKEVDISLKRKDKTFHRSLRVIPVGNTYKTGLYIKERLLGIGTVSFYDPESHRYGALGHEISDHAGNAVIDVQGGSIYTSSVTSVKKSYDGTPGAKVADFSCQNPIGTIYANTPYGIYGEYKTLPKDAITLEMAEMEEAHTGHAEIWTVLSGAEIGKYSIDITHLESQDEMGIKGITFRVDDKTLLNTTGGIVAGMSGSPIIQDNKLLGAVTHVFVDDVDHGYGIYMEWMVEKARSF